MRLENQKLDRTKPLFRHRNYTDSHCLLISSETTQRVILDETGRQYIGIVHTPRLTIAPPSFGFCVAELLAHYLSFGNGLEQRFSTGFHSRPL